MGLELVWHVVGFMGLKGPSGLCLNIPLLAAFHPQEQRWTVFVSSFPLSFFSLMYAILTA